MTEIWHRFTDRTYANPLDEYDEPTGTTTYISHEKFAVVSRTPKGVWLYLGFGGKRFVLNSATKRFADPTEERAKISFLARKEKQRAIYQARADKITWVIQKMKREFPADLSESLSLPTRK